MKIANEVADTNELFLRSVQLWNMFEDPIQPRQVRNENHVRRGANTTNAVMQYRLVMTLFGLVNLLGRNLII